ncbi:MAG: hydrogenase maturation protease [Limisphaerales bacterium]|jgi:hydrogenase maturation protease
MKMMARSIPERHHGGAMDAGGAGGRTLVLGLGNDILRDDGVGLVIVRELAKKYAGRGDIEVCETMEMGLALLDFMVGFERVILVDSIQTGRVAPGVLHVVDVGGWRELSGSTPHFLGVGETLALGRQLGLDMPADVQVVAVEVEDPFALGTDLTLAVAGAVEPAVGRVSRLLEMGLASAAG